MSDVADMLGLSKTQSVMKVSGTDPMNSLNDKKEARQKKKPKGMKREVFDLLGPDGLVPASQVPTATAGFKSKRNTNLKGKWVYDVISSSARSDTPSLRHWVKADITFVDYPYAKFNVQLDHLELSEEEYQSVEDTVWSREETNALLALCHQYDLRWPIIYDRYAFPISSNPIGTARSIEDLMARYYTVVQKIRLTRNAPQIIGGRGEDVMAPFDAEKERKRRQQQDMLFRRTREDEAEELKLKEELKNIEQMLKKNKKVVKAPASAVAAAPIAAPLGESYQAPLADSKGLTLATTTQPIVEVYSGPVPGRPCLQSSRLYLTPANLNLSKGVLGKMNNYLKELGLPERPIATKAVCDLVDAIRRDTVALVSMSSLVGRKEKDLGSAKSNSGKSSSKSGQKTTKPKPAKKAPTSTAGAGAAGGEGVDEVKLEPGVATLGLVSSEVAPLDLELADGPLDLLDVFDPVGTVDAPLQPPAKPKPAPRKRNRSKKDSAPATEPAGVALPAEVHPDAKFEESMAFFDDISGLDLVELPANKKSKH